jgi:hypothetical protein
MAMPFEDFFRRMTGQPMQLPGAEMADRPTTATVARPTMDQLQAQDYQYAAMNRMGQLGMLLMAAGQRLTPAQRATILGQAPQYMDGIQSDVAQASQARLMGARMQQEQAENERAQALRQRLADPQFLSALGIKPEMAEALGPAGIQKLVETQAMSNTPDAQLHRRLQQAQIDHYNRPPAPEAPTVVTLSDGRQAIIPRGQTAPIPLETPQAVSNVPPGVDPQKWRTEQTKLAVDQQTKALEAEKILPNVVRARQAYEAGQGYIGPAQSSSIYRGIQGALGAQGETKRSDIENKLAAYQKQLVIQSLPPGAASDKDIAEARRGMASIGDTSTVAGLASIDADIARTLGMMGYNIPPAHISELIKDIRSQNREGVQQFIEAHRDGQRIVGMIGGAL